MNELIYITLGFNILGIGISVGTLLTTVRQHGKDIERHDKLLGEHDRQITYLEAKTEDN